MYPKTLFLLAAASWLISAAAVAATPSGPVADPMGRPALTVRAPAKIFLAALARAGNRLVAVGEHGLVILSDDGGASWRQARVPTSATLTAVQFPSPKQGWAVGHFGIILHTADGGETWSRQLDGVKAAQLAVADARASRGQGPQADRYLADAERLVQDGPDKPFLAVHFADERNGLAVGAYNLAFRTVDGGATWESIMGRLDNPKGSHLYALRTSGNTIFIAGEQGLMLRSTDKGAAFQRLDTGYKGSFFALAVAGNDVVAAGLRGNVVRSSDQGATWSKIENPVPASIMAIATRADGSLLLASQAGQLLATTPGGGALVPVKGPRLPPLNDLLLQSDGSIVGVSMFGALRLPPTAGTPPEPMAAK